MNTLHGLDTEKISQYFTEIFIHFWRGKFHEVNISQVLLQVQSGDKVLTALEAGKRYVPMLLLDVYFQGESLSGLELAMVTVDEEAHVLCLDVAVQSTLPPALEATELTGELHLEKR